MLREYSLYVAIICDKWQLKFEVDEMMRVSCCQLLKQCAADMKPVADRLSKTGSSLMKLVADDEAERIREVVDDLTSRFDSVKNVMRQRANKLDDALQQMSEVCLSVCLSVCLCLCVLVTPPSRGVEYCDQFVCLCVCEHISGTTLPIFTKFCAQIRCGHSSFLLWWHCDMLCTSGFMDYVTFGHNGHTTSSVEIPVWSLMSMNALLCCVLLRCLLVR